MQVLVAQRELARGNRTAILTPRKEILSQTLSLSSSVLGAQNVTVMRAKRPDEYWRPMAPVHVISWPTLIRRLKQDPEYFLPRIDRLLVDECHLSVAPQMAKVLGMFPDKVRVTGWTATPERSSGRGLGTYFTEIKHVTTVRQLMQQGYLAELEYFGASTPDLTGIQVRRGDYEVGKLSKACVELVGDAIDNWLRLAQDRHTITFAVDIQHCEALADRFNQVGIKAEALHTGLIDTDRDRVVEAFKAGRVQVLVNVGIASYGFDDPEVDCVQICRPTKSRVLHLQMLGRGMRQKPDGRSCMVLDHASNVLNMGMADDLVRWRLDESMPASENWSRREESGEKEDTEARECEQCRHLFKKSRVCPKCGWVVPAPKRDVDTKDADLVPIGRNKAKPLPDGFPDHATFYAMLRHYAAEKGRKPGSAYYQFIEKAGCPPDNSWKDMAMVPPSPRVKNWIHSRNIAYAKGKGKGKGARR